MSVFGAASARGLARPPRRRAPAPRAAARCRGTRGARGPAAPARGRRCRCAGRTACPPSASSGSPPPGAAVRVGERRALGVRRAAARRVREDDRDRGVVLGLRNEGREADPELRRDLARATTHQQDDAGRGARCSEMRMKRSIGNGLPACSSRPAELVRWCCAGRCDRRRAAERQPRLRAAPARRGPGRALRAKRSERAALDRVPGPRPSPARGWRGSPSMLCATNGSSSASGSASALAGAWLAEVPEHAVRDEGLGPGPARSTRAGVAGEVPSMPWRDERLVRAPGDAAPPVRSRAVRPVSAEEPNQRRRAPIEASMLRAPRRRDRAVRGQTRNFSPFGGRPLKRPLTGISCRGFSRTCRTLVPVSRAPSDSRARPNLSAPEQLTPAEGPASAACPAAVRLSDIKSPVRVMRASARFFVR